MTNDDRITQELEAIAAEAARLPLLTPSRDLWDGIEARIATTPRTLPFYRRQTVRLAIAASLLVAVSSGVTYRLVSTKGPAAVTAAASSASGVTEDAALGVLVDGDEAASATHLTSFSASVTQVERDIAALQTIVTERRGELDPRTVAILEANLKLIDSAIAESRAALAADPASQFLSAQYTRAYISKLTLLREVATLPAGI